LIAGILVGVLAILMIVLLVLPKMTDVTEAQDELSKTEAQGVTLQARREALEGAQADAPANEATIAQVRAQIPEVADQPGLYVLLDNAASSAGLAVAQISITEPVFDPATGLSVMTIAVSAEGTYFQIADFTYNIQTLPRAAKILNLDLSAADASSFGSPTLSMSATMEAYTSDADPSLPGPQDEPAVGGTDEGGA
jgi:Tfp pilus assembly protein PilO